jgi:hypothetical protein
MKVLGVGPRDLGLRGIYPDHIDAINELLDESPGLFGFAAKKD